jgi:hypothetical protein
MATHAASDEDPSRIWIERPWEYRYVIYIDSPYDYQIGKKVGLEYVAAKKINQFRIEPLFPLTVSITTDPEHYRGEDKAIGAIVIPFDQEGYVTATNDLSLTLRGRITRPWEIVLSAGDKPDSWQFHLGYWYRGNGRNADELLFTPAICNGLDMAAHFHDKTGRYIKGYAADSLDQNGNFGCREWGYYLQSDEFPYIDVTSYGKDKYGPFSYIRPILGWGRFDIPPKPVIGKHGDVWVCLHECPNGEAPGIIPNIKLWAARNGWPAPKRPKKQPMFPDRQYKHGEFID